MTRKEAFHLALEVEALAQLSIDGIVPWIEVGGIADGLIGLSPKVREALLRVASAAVLDVLGLTENDPRLGISRSGLGLSS